MDPQHMQQEDLAAILYRARTYDFDKALYLTSYEQVLHFKQVFEVAKLLGIDKKIYRWITTYTFWNGITSNRKDVNKRRKSNKIRGFAK